MAGKKHENSGQKDNNIIMNGMEPDNQKEDGDENNISEEYDMLDSRLDELNSALDYLEHKNDVIHAKLKELLQSNRDIRLQLRNENNSIINNESKD